MARGMKTEMAPVVKGDKALAKMDQRALQTLMDEDDSVVGSGGTGALISTKNGAFTFNSMPLPQPMHAVIVAAVAENVFYDTGYDPENPSPPACFAIGKTKHDDLAPHPDAPNPQAEACAVCPHNQFGSRGTRGKECANRFRLALISADVDEFSASYIQETDMAQLGISPTGLAGFRTYRDKLKTAASLPLQAAITEFDMAGNKSGNGFHVTTKLSDQLDGKQLNAVIQRREEAYDMLLKPYDVSGYAAPARGKKEKAAAAKPRGGVLGKKGQKPTPRRGFR